MEDLLYKGKEANHDLSFRQWNKSKHAQYFTPVEVANAIFNGFKGKIDDIKRLKVLDPTAGSGRLLMPWKKAEANVLGIELEEEAGKVLKHNIGAKSSRIGDIMKYAQYTKDEQFDLVITNPPFGITWNIENSNLLFKTKRYDDKIESQAATLEIAVNSLSYDGILVAIIPTSTFTNDKDKKLVQFLHKEMEVLLRLTMEGIFKKEYGIDVTVDILVARSSSEWKEDEKAKTIKATINSFEEISRYIADLDLEIDGGYGNREIAVPDISNLITFPIGNKLELEVSGVGGDPAAMSLVDFYDEVMEAYNPVFGCRTGVKEAFLSSPALMSEGPEKAIEFFQAIGFETIMNESVKARLEKLKKRYDFLSLPMFQPKSHQLLAYFKDRPYTAVETIRDAKGKVLFEKDKTYSIRPNWIRNMQVVKVEDVMDSKGKPVKKTTSIDQGYLSIEVKSEQGDMKYNEPDTKELKQFIKAFGLPRVKSLDDVVPERIRSYESRLKQLMPQLFDYQLHDLARLCTKQFGYIGYEMGGGKTITAIAYCLARGTKWNLVICQASLVDNWVNEGRKFGISIERVTTHTAVDALLDQRKAWKGKDKKELPIRFFVSSYEFLSLDTAKEYDPWQCIMTNKDGQVIHSETCTSKHCSRGHSRKSMVKVCPKCNDYKQWTGAFCRHCGYVASTYKEIRQYPAYKRLDSFFSTVIVDEAQLAKNISGRGLAVRAMKSKCKLLLSGTIQRGFVSDVYHNFGWLLGHANPLFPYPRKGGSGRFLEEFGTFEFVSMEFKDTLTTGRRKIIPEVSNLNRFWRILGAFTIRRLKEEMVELPEKRKSILLLDMDPEHDELYAEYAEWAKKQIDKELRKPEAEMNMGVISRCLWALRFAATAPNDSTHLLDKGPQICIERRNYNKVQKIVEMVRAIEEKHEKVVIFSGLRSMVNNIEKELMRNEIKTMKITAAVDCQKRFGAIEEFQSNGYVALVAGLNVLNRGYTITKANHVIITDLEFQPESTQQAEDRVHRTGQTKPVEVTYLLSKGTIDESMLEIITQKNEAIMNSINGKAKYASTAELLRQMDTRRIELAVAKKILSQPINIKPKEERVPEKREQAPEPELEPIKWGTAKQLSLFESLVA